MWLILALSSSLVWAIVHILDEHCVDKIFSKPWIGVLTSSAISAGIFLLVPFSGQKIVIPSWEILAVCLLTGAVIQGSQYYYFLALDCSDCGTVSAYWNLTPTFLPVISYWLFGYVITGNNYVGIGMLILGSVGLCLNDRLPDKWDALYLMTIAASLQTIVVLLEKYIFDRTDFFGAFLAITVGTVAAGLSGFKSAEVRATFRANLPSIRQAWRVLVAIELLNWVALYLGQSAVKDGIPSLVSAIEASIPAFAFGLSMGIAFLNRQFDSYRKGLGLKLSMIGLMMVGVWLIGANVIDN
jgi:drug/metabolite transporter (DMT)-like permease